ncbi:hypothetical protein HMPREF0880_03062 [Yokenella regensburgei ATCC 43003]|nr:hypothetical protein HMPREF0880_03062 [Yokenella regensburgei ATCC 43003]
MCKHYQEARKHKYCVRSLLPRRYPFFFTPRPAEIKVAYQYVTRIGDCSGLP